MGGDLEKELLAELGVVAANPNDYEQALLAKAQNFADEKLLEHGEDLAGAQIFLRENDPELYVGAKHVQESLRNLESEILAVTAARDAAESALSKSPEADPSIEEDEDRSFRGQERMHLKLLDERLESLKKRRKALRVKLKKLKALRRGIEDAETAEASNDREDNHSASIVKNAENRHAGKQKVVALVEDDDFDAALDAASGFAVETEREKLIRKGIITPFSKVDGLEKRVRSSRGEGSSSVPNEDDELVKKSISNAVASMSALRNSRPTTRLVNSSDLPKVDPPTREFCQLRTPFKRAIADEEKNKAIKSGVKRKRPQAERKWKKRIDHSTDESESDSHDTSKTESSVEEPDKAGRSKLRRLRLKHRAAVNEDVSIEATGQQNMEDDDDEDQLADEQDVTFEGGLKIPGAIHSKLFDYQKTGVKWMWELHCQRAGGIIGDEMGLGKTVQVIAFLAALHYSGLFKPSIVICPVTLLRQWKREFRTWYPEFETAILHDSVLTGRVKKTNTKRNGSVEDTTESGGDEQESDSEKEGESSGKGESKWTSVINSVIQSASGVLITTYEQLRINREKLLDIRWGYAILDEGHRVRNPDAEVTLVCKQLQTVHRIIMTGAPIQNKLTELWSLFDYVFPGKLGVLPVFQSQFALPIQIGGYANATPLQVSTAYKCAVVLRDLVLPYLLRRMKADVNANLTKKTEHVLFCSLTEVQRSAYRAFLGSAEVEQIMSRQRNCLYGIDTLRKICNHPDLLEREHICGHADYGNPERSGKLTLVAQVLELWKRQGHRVLLFTQTQQMLDIVQNFAEAKGYEYRRMDGSTAIKHRMALIDEFNESEHVFLFILTTKVGGLGTNLTGANRVIIFDPDWNPSTDMQARERAWRIGQKKDVTIYRLVTKGTIEEKVYHRQIFKHFLTDKVLKDPNQRRFFKAKDLRDLFILQEDTSGDNKTETAVLFGDDVGNIMSSDQALQEASGALQTNSLDQKVTGEREAGSSGRNTKLKGKKKSGEDVEEEESRVLKDLFGANGIHSAMDHDAILAVSDKEKMMVDQEAGRVAQRATSALLESRMLRSADNVAVPTWTGRSGEAGAPAGLRPRFGATASRRSSTAATSVVQTTATAQQRSTHVNGTSVSIGRTGGLGSGATSLSSSDVLRRMQERQNGPLGVSPSGQNLARRHVLSASSSTTLQSSTVAMQAGANSCTSSFQSGGLSSSRFGRRIQGANPASLTSAVDDIVQKQSPFQTSVKPEDNGNPHPSGERKSLPMQVLGSRSLPSPPRGGIGIKDFQSLPKHVSLGLREQETLFAEISSFIQRKGGSVQSATIADHFRPYLRSKDVPLFKSLLEDAAKLQKDPGGVSRWVLRERPL